MGILSHVIHPENKTRAIIDVYRDWCLLAPTKHHLIYAEFQLLLNRLHKRRCHHVYQTLQQQENIMPQEKKGLVLCVIKKLEFKTDFQEYENILCAQNSKLEFRSAVASHVF